MQRRKFLKKAFMGSAALSASTILPILLNQCTKKEKSPNIVLMYADDLGYGDLSCYGAHRVNTQNIDRIAKDGIRFNQAHSTAATCTPSRYSLLTGEYAWRREGTGIAGGDAPLIINPNKTTLPDILKQAGYKTGIVGKWDLGLGSGNLDWNKKIKPGPPELGFDYSFIIPATGDRVPCVYVKNHHVVGLDKKDSLRVNYNQKVGDEPTGIRYPELLKMGADKQHSGTIINGISRIGYMSGADSARWVDEKMALVLKNKVCSFIKENKNSPFFIYYSFHDIHVPRVPNEKFVGETEMGPRGDVIVELDWCVGEVLKKLEQLGLSENTIVIFTSDNGPVLNDGYEDYAVEKVGSHEMTGPLRGGKYSSFEGGTRIPFVIRWPERIKTGKVSNALISQIDCMSSFANLTGQSLKKNEAIDSRNLLPTLLGKKEEGREYLVEQAMGGFLSLRTKNWKYIPIGKGPKYMKDKGIETGRSSHPQLYNLKKDRKEQNNVAAEYPKILEKMDKILKRIKSRESGL